jgi:hypothetical protein
VNGLPDAFPRRLVICELDEIQFLQLLAREPAQNLAARAATRLQFLPKALIGIELVHQPLGEPLFGREIVVWIHGEMMKQKS